jgi:hypothetical protein
MIFGFQLQILADEPIGLLKDACSLETLEKDRKTMRQLYAKEMLKASTSQRQTTPHSL